MNQQPTAQGQAGQPGQQQVRLLKPEQMRTVTYLSDADKVKYEAGLRQLWTKVNETSPESREHQEAKMKIAEFSRMVVDKIRTIHARQNQQGGQPGQPSQPVQQMNQAAQGQAMAAAAPKPIMPPNRPQPTAAAGPVANEQSTMAANAPAAGNQIPKHLLEHINKLPWGAMTIPPHIGPEGAQKWLAETKTGYLRALIQMENCKNKVARMDAMLKERQEKNMPLTPEEQKRFSEQRNNDLKLHTDSDAYAKKVRGMLSRGAQPPAGQAVGAQGANGAAQARAQAMQATNSGGVASTHPMQAATASVNAAMDAAKNHQLAAANLNRANSLKGPQQLPQQPTSQAPQTPVTPATPSINTLGPQSTTQAHTAPAPPAQVKVEPGTSAQHPPPVNTNLAAASTANMTSAGTPTQGSARVQTPQSAQPTSANGNPRALTHAAAVNQANNSSSNVSRQASNAGLNTNTPGSAGIGPNSAQAAHSHAHPQPTATLNSKFSIPKTLPEKATAPPVPVAIGGGNTAGRPTYGGGNGAGGVMNQPVITKMPIPQFDAEGDHVMSKKKLDELARQVCGGGSPSADGNYLTPDVEESVLNVADNFVDNVIQSACRLAKERGSKVLEIRDIQLVLERVYNIRIPGYTSDELRTVRKVQPSSNWIAKMSAIQAAKVTSSKDDK
ncbi:hypothetical protein F5Y16DRAFT_384084 [Xylariaceae sp. FL0255]|nr:hypothetical protein F5Y16DRAFT_384084 [Xylariaceae sp. FL0255]